MSDEARDRRRRRFAPEVGRKAERWERARGRRDNPWFWLGMLGLIGWSVAIPTVLGVALGLWLDDTVPATFSWTLTMLVLGLALGIFNAWYWVTHESTGDDKATPSSEEPP